LAEENWPLEVQTTSRPTKKRKRCQINVLKKETKISRNLLNQVMPLLFLVNSCPFILEILYNNINFAIKEFSFATYKSHF
jgi:hypothetical protein